jgi:uncharacterized SAM-binding protein YcdF (DUF218 family)
MLSRIRLATIGRDGLVAFLLSNLVLALTGGGLLAVMLYRVLRTARQASSQCTSSGCRLVLGHMLSQGRPSARFIARLERALSLAPIAPVLVLGGQTAAAGPSEAAAGREYLLARGLAPALLRIEDSSRHTLENLQLARPLIVGADLPVLITCRFHLARSRAMAKDVGLEVQLCAAESALVLSPQEVVRLLCEAYLLHWYYVGRSWSRLTRNQRALARIS